MSVQKKKKTNRLKRLQVRLNEAEWQRLEEYAESCDQSMSECVRDWIKSLPKSEP